VTGYLVEPADHATPLILAIGRTIVSVAGLEKMLLAEIVSLRMEAGATQQEVAGDITRLESTPAGALLSALRELGLEPDLEHRIADAIDRRNGLVHRLYEDPVLARALVDPEALPAAVEQLEGLALDCAEIALELHLANRESLEAMVGSQGQLTEMVRALNPADAPDPRTRRQIEALQAFGDIDYDAIMADLISTDPSAADSLPTVATEWVDLLIDGPERGDPEQLGEQLRERIDRLEINVSPHPGPLVTAPPPGRSFVKAQARVPGQSAETVRVQIEGALSAPGVRFDESAAVESLDMLVVIL
jgi:hypothetical protein